ncbi:MAG: NUDIX hydrolase [Oscillospiraceae bacterium]
MHHEKKLSSKEIFAGRVVRLTVDEVELENGKPAFREVVHHNGGAAVVALNEKNEVALVRQFRYAAGRELLEIPAGKVEVGEDPRDTAIRELGEEAGLAADRFAAFGRIIPTCAYCTEVISLFVGTGLHEVARHLDADEFVDLVWMPLDEAVAMVLDGRIEDSKTVAGLLRAQLLQNRGLL